MHIKYRLINVCSFSAIFIFALIGCYYNGYRYNSTPSYPIGIYKVNLKDKKVIRNKLILICPPNSKQFKELNRRGYVSKGFCPSGYEPLIKKIAGISGDTVLVNSYVYINGIKQKNSKVYNIDPQGYNLSPISKRVYHIKENQIFILSDYNDKSFDSRYFGPLNSSLIQGSIKPVFVW